MRARERNVQEGQKRLGNTLGHRPEAFPPARGKKEGLHGRKAPGVRRETELQRRATTVGSTDKLRLSPNASRLTILEDHILRQLWIFLALPLVQLRVGVRDRGSEVQIERDDHTPNLGRIPLDL